MTINVPEMGVKYTRDCCKILLNTFVDKNEDNVIMQHVKIKNDQMYVKGFPVKQCCAILHVT